MNTRSRQHALAAFLSVALLPPAMEAQMSSAPDTVQRPNHARLFTADDAGLAAGFAALTVAMFPIDKSIARRLQHDTLQKGFADRGATAFELLSVPGAYIIGPAIYLYGRYGNHSAAEDLGLHSTEAVVLATGITGVLKGLLGRSRPYVTRDSNPHDFAFAKGFTGEDRSSFPSAHAAVAFAAASSVTSELAHLWPGHTAFVAPLLYGGATLVGVGRMYHDKHWASDVALGAGIGIFSGLKVVRYEHDHPDNYVDRMLLHASIAPDAHGRTWLGLTFPFGQ
ncbi:MAG: phosphatase PAP2 family protein [bacterium]